MLTHRSGVKNNSNICTMSPLPGLLSTCAGVRVIEYDPLGSDSATILGDQGERYSASQWADVLELDTAEAIAVYADQFYAKTAAVTRNRWGQGNVYYMATQPEQAYLSQLLRSIAEEHGLSEVQSLPQGVQITTRTGPGGTFRFILNLSPEAAIVDLGAEALSALDASRLGPKLELPPYGVEIIEVRP